MKHSIFTLCVVYKTCNFGIVLGLNISYLDFLFVYRFLFSECTRLTSVGGEKSLAAMIGTLCEAVEKEYGFLVTRLFRVFKPSEGIKSYFLLKEVFVGFSYLYICIFKCYTT